eukprot:jgi/Mesvir1/29062/Mv18370-RA.1
MNASLSLRDDGKPVMRLKMPMQAKGVIFATGICAGEPEGVALRVGSVIEGLTWRFQVRPFNKADAPRLLVKTSLGTGGNSVGDESCQWRVAADCNLRTGTTRVSVRFKPRLGAFTLRHTNNLDTTGGAANATPSFVPPPSAMASASIVKARYQEATVVTKAAAPSVRPVTGCFVEGNSIDGYVVRKSSGSGKRVSGAFVESEFASSASTFRTGQHTGAAAQLGAASGLGPTTVAGKGGYYSEAVNCTEYAGGRQGGAAAAAAPGGVGYSGGESLMLASDCSLQLHRSLAFRWRGTDLLAKLRMAVAVPTDFVIKGDPTDTVRRPLVGLKRSAWFRLEKISIVKMNNRKEGQHIICGSCVQAPSIRERTPSGVDFASIARDYKKMRMGFPCLKGISSSQLHDLKAVSLAQWMHESSHGRSRLAAHHCNYGGLKWRPDMRGLAFPILYEAHDGPDTYCSFHSSNAYIKGFWKFLNRAPFQGWQEQVANLRGDGACRAFLEAIHGRGYATDPSYVHKVMQCLPEARELLNQV